jgi:siroheme decarboxylase
LKANGIIRLIGPVLNPRRLGYQTTLVAAKVQPEQLKRASFIISRHPLVSHCYERNHDFNLWFTMAAPAGADIEGEVGKLGNQIKSEAILNLPAIKTFKIGAYFRIDGGDSNLSFTPKHNHRLTSANDNSITTVERAVINALQSDLPLRERPFDIMSAERRMDTDEFLSQCRALLQRGIMRRFSASINHYKLGFKANAMSCWKVPEAMVAMAGKQIATFPEVSHCYERRPNTLWPYNMFAMVHADNKKQCRDIIDKIELETGLASQEHVILFSTREVKKTRIRYPV